MRRDPKHAAGRTALALAAALLILAGGAADAPAEERVALSWDHYYDHDEVTGTLRELARAYPDLTRLETIGRSAEGRDIMALTITSERTGPAPSKPGIYADGAIHGNEIQATEVCLYLAWHLLSRYGEWDRITALVDSVAFYIVPTVNVDGRARFFADPGGYNIGRSARQPHDDDHDGLADEDDYEDIDGDGQILQMRIADPFGTHRTHPDDPRVMIRTKPGEQGEWRRLGLEGIDNDGDGRVNEDPPGYLDMNRNWGFKWQPGYVQSGSGDYPFSAPSTRAIAAFIAARPNIACAFNFHNYGGMFLRGPGSDLSPPMPPGDLKVYDYLGEEGERVVPGYRYLVGKDDLYTTYGDFDEWMYQCLGVYAFVSELFMESQTAYRGVKDTVLGEDGTPWSRDPQLTERQQFNDRLMAGEMFEPWRDFDHPTYGRIQIGGWRQFTTRMPPFFMIQEMAHRNAMYVIWTATQLPKLDLAITEVKELEGGLYRVRARVSNAGAVPTVSAKARSKQIYRSDLFTCEGKSVTVHAGGILLDPWFDEVEPQDHHPERIATHVDGFGTREVQWIVSGGGKLTIGYDSLKGGRREAIVELR